MNKQTWRDDARCRDMGDEQRMRMFYPGGKPEFCATWPVAGCLFCRGCDVREECLAEALRLNDPDGIWGGVRPDLRQRFAHRKSPRELMEMEDQRVDTQRARAQQDALRRHRRDARKAPAKSRRPMLTLVQCMDGAT